MSSDENEFIFKHESPASAGTDPESPGEEESWGDRLLVPREELSPRHRRFAELLASGASNKEIKEKMGFTDSWISTLRSNSMIRAEAERIRERIYEDTIGKRLRAMAEPALNEIEKCITDRHNRYKPETRVETSKWLIEKLDGKAVQKHDLGENVLAIVMDKLDSLRASGRSVSDIIDVTGTTKPALTHDVVEKKPKTEQESLSDWVDSYVGETKS